MSDKLVSINIRPGIRLPANVEGVDVVAADMLVELTTKQRLMTLRSGLFRKGDPDWPKKVERVEVVAEVVAEETLPPVEEKTVKSKGKKNDGDNPT